MDIWIHYACMPRYDELNIYEFMQMPIKNAPFLVRLNIVLGE